MKLEIDLFKDSNIKYHKKGFQRTGFNFQLPFSQLNQNFTLEEKRILHRLLFLWKCCTLQFIVLIQDSQTVVSSSADALRDQIEYFG